MYDQHNFNMTSVETIEWRSPDEDIVIHRMSGFCTGCQWKVTSKLGKPFEAHDYPPNYGAAGRQPKLIYIWTRSQIQEAIKNHGQNTVFSITLNTKSFRGEQTETLSYRFENPEILAERNAKAEREAYSRSNMSISHSQSQSPWKSIYRLIPRLNINKQSN